MEISVKNTIKEKLTVAVVGGGASGMLAAITAAAEGAEVTLYERTDRIGKKLLATGNGKCNLGNLDLSMEQYYCSDKKKLQGMFERFSVWDAISFFEDSGLLIKNKNGYLYPYAEQASAVLDILRMKVEEAKVRLITQTEITGISYEEKKKVFCLQNKEGKRAAFDRVILACGSPASLKKGEGLTGYDISRKLGHRVWPILPGLVQLLSDEDFCRALAGVRCQGGIRLFADKKELASDAGEIQFTESGVSGIPVFQLSRTAGYALREKKEVEVCIDFFPDWDKKRCEAFCRKRFEENRGRTLEAFLTGTLNKKVNMVLIKRCGCKPSATAEEAGCEKVRELFESARNLRFHITGTNPLEKAQVCAGGISFDEIDENMQSKLLPGLYFAGEMLDVDGKCGGYNLQWAWTSGYLAGKNAAGKNR